MSWQTDWIWVLYMAPDGTKMIIRQLRTDQAYERDERKSVSNLTGSWEPIKPDSMNWSPMAILDRRHVVGLIKESLRLWMEL